MQAIGAGYGAYLPPPMIHNRSISVGPHQNGGPRASVSKAKSTTALRPSPVQDRDQESAFHTLQDPRNTSTSDLTRKESNSSKKDGVDLEVAALSDKLISAINHQQVLDDTLAQTRHELEAARKLIQQLEARTKEHQDQLSRGDLLRKISVDKMSEKLNAELAEAKKERTTAQQEKRGMETELENLTASLFDEANKMVASANKEREATEKKNQQLRDQIKDEEAVIASQTEQLTELKNIMVSIQSDHRKEMGDSPRISQGPGTPKADEEEVDIARFLGALDLEPTGAGHEVAPSPSTRFTHLIRPQCRTDVPAYEDFKDLVQTGGNARAHNHSHAASRSGSGSYGGLNVIGLGSIYSANNISNPNLSQPAGSRGGASPAPPGSFSPNTDQKGPAPLKDTRFFKRIMLEDVEPTLRMDLSPSISWLSRRSILGAFADSTLIVEPIPQSTTQLYGRYTPCSLCGESRRKDENPRTHAMRVREGEGATKWAICVLCLEKVRAVGDLVGYIRMVRDGVVKCGDGKEEEEAWDELIRLRERLFWARMAGGVVPAFMPSNKNSPIPGDNDRAKADRLSVKNASGVVTPNETPRTSEDGTDQIAKQTGVQLPDGLEEKLTTFENVKEQATKRASLASTSNSTPPKTPPTKRESGGFPRLNIPKLPQGFWDSQVNALH